MMLASTPQSSRSITSASGLRVLEFPAASAVLFHNAFSAFRSPTESPAPDASHRRDPSGYSSPVSTVPDRTDPAHKFEAVGRHPHTFRSNGLRSLPAL